MRTPLIAGNWKMNKTHLDAIHFLGQLGHELDRHNHRSVEVALCPPFTALRSVQTNIEDRHQSFKLGAQDMHWEAEGAFTGEVSPTMLKALNVDYVILGHSERPRALRRNRREGQQEGEVRVRQRTPPDHVLRRD